ncbi:uncharacterized protein BDZ99DRAFT_506144 [Mytilinidion resinicola]|uniref:Transcription factor domain-containing protein n=1 Tax=Mytilinidion resinicola TaxID=574789 RepID=A0A6A6Z398_9PEZI|nr:uncharacterized protein BDZ99DRAFT_506144 [Mytilinidion resinicola]KAF2814754.1 hypothetical protein BDZ99DRAFT_506144 [Mytilinidion resinicola]
MALSTNQTLMTNGLLRIYHDSMENALSCWLTEKTCPYGITIPSPALLKNSNPHESMSEEWGSNWSNRIFARVCRLDRASSVVRGRLLTQSEEKLASKALHLAIMSFATQWAQSSNRSTAKFSSFDSKDDEVIDDGAEPARGEGSSPLSTEFDRSIQESFWYQARRALQDSAEIESFRVIFAHIIFSLTQRPLNVAAHVRAIKGRRRRSSAKRFNDSAWPGASPPSSESTRSGHCSATACGASTYQTTPGVINTSNSGVAGLDEVTELEGPPIFLETALRQIFSYRCKLESIERQRTIAMKKCASPEMAENPNILSTKDRKTFDLLFWLAVMFDTLSAAMNKRPLVVSDEDSDIRDGNLPGQHISQDDIISNPSPTYRSMLAKEGDSKLWGDFLLRQKHLRFCHKIARWPCSYEDAASTLCDAAPIKVLLFRKVTHLQTLLSRRVMYEKLEQTILDALQVYQHWNDSYNQFILDCIANHDDLPPRIQSWYVVLAGHWHLAALLLADIIEVIDDGQLGLESQQNVRHSSRLVSKLREQNANVLSDLGRCSCPGYNLSFPQAREFHFAVSEGALLTEPWTVVLIRAFSKAGYILLNRISHPRPSWYERGEIPRESEIAQCQQRLSFCIRALWNLGKKSDMAFLAATALSTALKDVTDEIAGKAEEFQAITGSDGEGLAA